MSGIPFRFPGPVTLVGGGPVDPVRLAACLEIAPDLMAADGGGDVPLPAGHEFHGVIGDMDSVLDRDGLTARGVTLHAVAEQDSTDLEKCLTRIAAPLILGVGFLGGRVDHQLAAMNILARFPEKRTILVGSQDVCFSCPDRLSLDLAAGTRVSLFPMSQARAKTGTGLKWSPVGIEFSPAGLTGTSNEAMGGQLDLAFEYGSVVVILPLSELRQVVDVMVSGRDQPSIS